MEMVESSGSNDDPNEVKQGCELSNTKALSEQLTVDKDFDDFNWSTEKNNEAASIANIQHSQIKEEPETSGVEGNINTCLDNTLPENQLAIGLINMPKNIPYNDIPSRYTESIEDALNLTAEERVEFAESAKRAFETRNDENPIAAKLCRLHPSNARFNQGPVENPPLINPGKMVEFTPAGQRYEVDLNEGRPTYFRSEYSRMQYDDATILNHTRTMSEVKAGTYLPRSLNDDVERSYIADQKFVENMIKEVLNEEDSDGRCCVNTDSSSDDSDDDSEAFKKLKVELKLLKFHKNVVVTIHDRPIECLAELLELFELDLQSYMFVKNPQLLELMNKLIQQTEYPYLQIAASNFYEKIKSCFDVPEGVTFEEYFQSQVKDLRKELTTNKDPKSILKAIMYTK